MIRNVILNINKHIKNNTHNVFILGCSWEFNEGLIKMCMPHKPIKQTTNLIITNLMDKLYTYTQCYSCIYKYMSLGVLYFMTIR